MASEQSSIVAETSNDTVGDHSSVDAETFNESKFFSKINELGYFELGCGFPVDRCEEMAARLAQANGSEAVINQLTKAILSLALPAFEYNCAPTSEIRWKLADTGPTPDTERPEGGNVISVPNPKELRWLWNNLRPNKSLPHIYIGRGFVLRGQDDGLYIDTF